MKKIIAEGRKAWVGGLAHSGTPDAERQPAKACGQGGDRSSRGWMDEDAVLHHFEVLFECAGGSPAPTKIYRM